MHCTSTIGVLTTIDPDVLFERCCAIAQAAPLLGHGYGSQPHRWIDRFLARANPPDPVRMRKGGGPGATALVNVFSSTTGGPLPPDGDWHYAYAHVSFTTRGTPADENLRAIHLSLVTEAGGWLTAAGGAWLWQFEGGPWWFPGGERENLEGLAAGWDPRDGSWR